MANTPQSYAVKFRSLTPEKLAAIIVNEGDYHADAVAAARLELMTRMLSTEELDRVYEHAEKQTASKRETPTQGLSEHSKKTELLYSKIKKTSTVIWWRSSILKLILVYLLLSLALSIPFAITYYLNLELLPNSTSKHVEVFVIPILLLLTIGIGFKGYKTAWQGALFFISFKTVTSVRYVGNVFFDLGDSSSGFSAITSTTIIDLSIAILWLAFYTLLLYLLLRKDTKVASGISKDENKEMDELDHLL